MLLINPPIVKPSEPPPGLARLYGALHEAGVQCSVIDANIEGILHLLDTAPPEKDRWTRRAVRNRDRNLALIRNTRGYADLQRYKVTLSDINHLLEKAPGSHSLRLSLSNYHDLELSPVRSGDLLHAAEAYEANPFFEYFARRLSDSVEKENPEIIGFSLNFLSQALTAFAMMGFLKARFPKIRIVLGGGLITSWVRKPGWSNPFSGLVERLIDGPGEGALLALLGRNAGESSCKPAYLPFPLFDYFAPGPILPYSASSGCYWNRCAFCPEKAEGTAYEPIPAQRAARETQELASVVRPALIHFLDSALSPAFMRTLTEKPPGAPWYGFVRITRSLADEDFCRALRKSGCAMLKLGLESGDQGVIDMEEKGIDLSVASQALTSLKKAGIGTYVYLLLGTPSESEAEAGNTLNFVVRHSEWIDFLNLAIFNMPVNSPEAGKYGTSPHYEGDLSLYTGFSHPRGWARARVRQFAEKEFKKHPAIARIISKDPPFFTSNHAPFFCRG
ncbi:MAG: radical SAM protein [Syntrophobacteraceae bacterium]